MVDIAAFDCRPSKVSCGENARGVVEGGRDARNCFGRACDRCSRSVDQFTMSTLFQILKGV